MDIKLISYTISTLKHWKEEITIDLFDMNSPRSYQFIS